MALLTWRHGTTREVARRAVEVELTRLGYAGKVTWQGDRARASVGLGTILNAAGEIQDETIVIEKCGGAAGAVVLQKCRDLFERLFPGGGLP